jgi:FdhD protein
VTEHPERPASTTRFQIQRFKSDSLSSGRDWVVTEEPLEIRLLHHVDGQLEEFSFTITMRTPGHDFELAAGLLYAEGIVNQNMDIETMAFCVDEDVEQLYNIVNVQLRPDIAIDKEKFSRNVYAASSCGVCGKASLESLTLDGCKALADGVQVSANLIGQLPDQLRQKQSLFEKTGGLHAAGLFSLDGKLHMLREDVGRHNAVDKVIGYHLINNEFTLQNKILVLSGRAGYELLQKAMRANIPIVVSVGAPSSLAVDLAREFNLTLIGFAGNHGFNVYHGGHRLMMDE